MASRSFGSSTMQSAAGSRAGSLQMRHGSWSVTLKQVEQETMRPFTATSGSGSSRPPVGGGWGDVVGGALESEDREPLGGLGPDAGEPLQGLDESGDRLRVVGHGLLHSEPGHLEPAGELAGVPLDLPP